MAEPAMSVEELYDKLNKYIHWLAAKKATDHVLMEREELEGELYEQLVYGWMYYRDRGLTVGELLAVIKQMLNNRISELKYRFYLTHRSAEKEMMDLDDLECDGPPDPEHIVEHMLRFSGFLDTLECGERTIVDAILWPDKRMCDQVRLRTFRRSYVYDVPSITIDWKLVADALHIQYAEARQAWSSVKRKWRNYDKP